MAVRRTGSADAMEGSALARQQIAAGRTISQPWGEQRSAITGTGAGSRGQSQLPLTQYERTMEAIRNVPASFWMGGQTSGTPSGQGEGQTSGGGTTTGGGGAPEVRIPSTSGSESSNVDTLSKMYADALAELQRQYGVSQENINAAIARMEADPYNRANAYANLQIAAPRVAADPLAEYMAAAGLSGGQSAAAQRLSQAEADAYQQAVRNMANIMTTSQEQANLSRLADIGLIRTGAQQDLEQNLNMLRLGLEKERIGAVTGQSQKNLENQIAMRNAITKNISDIFSGQNVAPESILKLIESALAKINMNRWTALPTGAIQ